MRKVFTALFSFVRSKGGSINLPKPLYVEPAFTLYYPDMVYSNPRIAEVDLLVIFEGGYACVELKRRASRAAEDSLKYFVISLAQQPVFYAHSGSQGELGTVHHPTPFLVPWEKLRQQLVGDESQLSSYVESIAEGRKELFPLDNFLRLLLVYGSPSVCEALLSSPFLSRLSEKFQLVKTRFSQICAVKLIPCKSDPPHQAQGASGGPAPERVEKIVAVIPTLNSEVYQKLVAEAIECYADRISAREVILTCTRRSERDAVGILEMLEKSWRVQAYKEVVESGRGKDLEKAWAERISELCETSCVALFVGEVPKGVLTKLAESFARGERKPKLAVLVWKPKLDPERVIGCLKAGDLTETEKEVVLNVVEL
jgi:hypothetical protein